jgi:hypothetical protein
MDFGDRSDNPFSVSLSMDARPRKQVLKSGIRFFLLVGLCLSVTVVVMSQGRAWLVHRLTSDFASLTSGERKERLIQIAELGTPAVKPLVVSMSDPDLDVARTAFELLQQAQNDWSVLEPSQRSSRNAALVESLTSIAMDLPDDRTGWATRLLQQTLMETVDDPGAESRQIYEDANRAIELLSLSNHSRPSGLDPVPGSPSDSSSLAAEIDADDLTEPRRLAIRAQPLPVERAQANELWTQWPPPIETRFSREAPANERTESNAFAGQNASPVQPSETPSVYRSGGKLKSVPPEDEVALGTVSTRASGQDLARTETDVEATGIRRAAHLVDSPLQTYDDPSVIRWLVSDHATLREKAEAELSRRGYDQDALSIARQLAGADAHGRIEMVEAIARSNRVDPRPWLLMLLEDPSRDVRLRVISVMATMNDPALTQRLRLQLVDESDPTVAARIRRVLKLR